LKASAAWLRVRFLCSAVTGLIYQVVWVRQFGRIYGNTIDSASMVAAIFMLGRGRRRLRPSRSRN
jgi:hypothetical protein